ncbi:hypothetical protein PQQ59_33695 [Paraburkholderia aspalathi]|uniref:hypothetical protein n=1 Tax=Paraburkholderia aspalathi TaxID=1324617 RepID=UPI0038B86FA4
MSTYSNALDARTHWALHRISVIAGNDRDAGNRLLRARTFATLSGIASGLGDEVTQCPALLADVPVLRDAFMASFEAERDRRQKRRTREGLEDEVAQMAEEANRGCGLSYELFVKRFSQGVDRLLDVVEGPFQGIALEIATSKGYATPDERAAMQDEIEASGGCSLTGIDPYCCPCGRHE